MGASGGTRRRSTPRRAVLAARWGYLVPWAAGLCLYYRIVGPRRRFGSLRGNGEEPTDTPPGGPGPRSPTPSAVLRAVRMGALPRPLRASCLVRAMAGARMLNHYGYPAKVVIGVPDETKPGPDWKAHAWISLGASARDPNAGFLEIARLAM